MHVASAPGSFFRTVWLWPTTNIVESVIAFTKQHVFVGDIDVIHKPIQHISFEHIVDIEQRDQFIVQL